MLGNNSCGIHSVMGGRTADNIHELEILTYDGLRMRVGQTATTSWSGSSPRAAGAARSTGALRDLRDRYADRIRERYPQIPRRVSGYNLDELLPENGFNVARALVGTEGTCVTVLEATLAGATARRSARCWSCSATPTSSRRATTSRRSWSTARSAWKAIDERLIERHAEEAPAPRETRACCPRATAGCWSSSAARPGGGRRAGPRADARR